MYENNDFTERIRIKAEKLDWIKKQKGKNSAAGFLDSLLDKFIKQNANTKRKHSQN